MARLNSEAIIGQLSAHGFRHRSVAMSTEGEYLPTDVDWNNKDVPHLNHVHAWADDVTCVIDKDLQSTVSLQQILGMRFPVVITHYDTEPNHQTHFFTIMMWTVVTDHEFIAVTPTWTRAVTTYTVMANRFWIRFFPLIRRLLRRNYRQLMSEDVPLRERKGTLRSWGYRFGGDGAPIDIRKSLPIHNNNVIRPDPPSSPSPPAAVPVHTITENEWTLTGRSDHLGLKLTRRGSLIQAYPRMCPHEGADLDPTPASQDCLTCPWHGRRLGPVAVVDLDDPAARVRTDDHELHIEAGLLHVEVLGPAAEGSASSLTDRPGSN